MLLSGGTPYIWHSPLFQQRQVYDKPPFLKESIWIPRFFSIFLAFEWPSYFWHPCKCTYFSLRSRMHAQILVKPLFHIYIKQVFSWWGSFVNLLTNHRGYERVYQFKNQYMNMSTFCEIKYMNLIGCFFKSQVYDWGWYQNTGSHTRTKITPPPPPPPPPRG